MDNQQNLVQMITIKKFINGFILEHKHKDYNQESYLLKSNIGVLNSIENLLNGLQPDPCDMHRKEDTAPIIHTGDWKKPRPLD